MKAVLTIAGSDSCGGAGIQADLKTIAAHHLYGMSVITVLTAQNTTGVYGIEEVDPDFVTKQIDAVFDDIRPAAIKIGMVLSSEIIQAVAHALVRHDAQHIVVDPVMVATSGSALIADEAVESLVDELFPLAEVITPNLEEAQILSNMHIADPADMERAAKKISDSITSRNSCGVAVLIKGGHTLDYMDEAAELSGAADDVLYLPNGTLNWIRAKRIVTENTHGTGCTLSSAIACGLAQGQDVQEAVCAAKEYVSGALRVGLDLGKGSGPLDHMWLLDEKVVNP